MRKYFLSVILCILGVLCIISEPANAYDVALTDFDIIYTSVNTPYCQYNYLGTWGTQWTNESSEAIYNDGLTSGGINGWRCRSGSNNNLSTQQGDIWVQYFRVVDYFSGTGVSSYTDNNTFSHITYFYDVVNGTDENNIIDFQLVGETNDRNRRTQYYRVVGTIIKNTQNPDWGIQVRRDPVTAAQTGGTFWTRVVVMSQQQYRPKERLDYTNQLDDILDAIDNISTATGVKEGVEEAMEDEKEQIQDASDESAEAGEDAKDQAENATSSLSDNIATIISAIKDTPKSNCTVSFGTRLNLNNLDMCAAPSNLLTAIRAVVIIPITLAVLRTSYNLIMMFWHLMRKEQE